MHTSLEDRII